MSVDGTDFKINHPSANTGISLTSYYSYKINHSGLRYEVALNIQSGDIVWTSGPFPPGEWPGIRIFLSGLAHKLRPGEKVEADQGYQGWAQYIEDPNFMVPNNEHMATQKTNVRARHEMVNNRLKNFHCLKNAWRHHRDHHGIAFRCVAIVVQLSLESGNPLPRVTYQTRPLIEVLGDVSSDATVTDEDPESE